MRSLLDRLTTARRAVVLGLCVLLAVAVILPVYAAPPAQDAPPPDTLTMMEDMLIPPRDRLDLNRSAGSR